VCRDAHHAPSDVNRSIEEEEHMLDVVFLAATVFFVAVAILYVRGCERLR
jgi:hypothetical protein